ncbi:basic proline-rich protein-like [Lutra lutra]|uniref:basic proline-rich protein-like n=1 Tax=Lutra lutra TaxID=9657 RepID=UPI001FD11964|nr:basic proline-rich protein-like [Lutra lutra]
MAAARLPAGGPAAATEASGSGSGRAAGLRSPAPRPASPELAPRALPGRLAPGPPPPSRGRGRGRRAAGSRAPRAHPGVRARGSRPPPRQAARGGAAGPAARRGGARRAALCAELGAVPTPTPTAVHCGGASGSGHELRRRGSASARAGPSPPPGPLPEPARRPARPLGRQVPTPGPVPAPARPRSHRTASGCPHILELAGSPELGENARLPGRSSAPAAGRPRAPAPASRIARAPSAPPARAYLQPGTATDTRRGLPALTASRPGTGWTRGAGARLRGRPWRALACAGARTRAAWSARSPRAGEEVGGAGAGPREQRSVSTSAARGHPPSLVFPPPAQTPGLPPAPAAGAAPGTRERGAPVRVHVRGAVPPSGARKAGSAAAGLDQANGVEVPGTLALRPHQADPGTRTAGVGSWLVFLLHYILLGEW